MSSTTVVSLIRRAQRVLERNTGDDFKWTETELLEYFDLGVQELWREIKELNEDYFLTVNDVNVTLSANSATLSGVPTDIDTIHSIGSRTPSVGPGFLFTPSRYKDLEFQRSLGQVATDPSGYGFHYALSQAGGPVGAVTIHIAPLSTSALNLRLVYTPTLAPLAITDTNPIPGQSDAALIAYALAWAMAKTTKEKAPSSSYLQMFEAAKTKLLVSLTSRQIDEPKYVEAVFEDYW